jgi:excisionase family DNA binding protein
MSEEKLTVKESANYLGTTVAVIYSLLKKGTLSPIKESPRKTLISMEDLENYKNSVSGEKVEEVKEEIQEPVEEVPAQEFIIPEKGMKINVFNANNREKFIWRRAEDNSFEQTEVDTPFVGVIEDIVNNGGTEFIFLIMDGGESRWCVMGNHFRDGLFPLVEDDSPSEEQEACQEVQEEEPIPTTVEEVQEPLEEVSEHLEGDVEEPQEPKEELKEEDLDKKVFEDHRIWDLVKLADKSMKDFLQEKGSKNGRGGYDVDLGRFTVTYQPQTSHENFDWARAMQFFLDNRYMIWKKLKEDGSLPQIVIDEVERTTTTREEIKIK